MRRCPVNALEPFRVLGLQPEYMSFSVVGFVVLQGWLKVVIGPSGPFIAMAIIIPAALGLQKGTQDRLKGYLFHSFLLWMTAPPRARYIRPLCNLIDREFLRSGVLPPSNLRNSYEG